VTPERELELRRYPANYPGIENRWKEALDAIKALREERDSLRRLCTSRSALVREKRRLALALRERSESSEEKLKRANRWVLDLQRDLVESFRTISDNNGEIAALSEGKTQATAAGRAKAFKEAMCCVQKMCFVNPKETS